MGEREGMSAGRSPYLSVVVTSRNDDHGGDPLKRLQTFVNCFDAQCRRTGLDAEVIIVEWNPLREKPRAAHLARCEGRVHLECVHALAEPADDLQHLRLGLRRHAAGRDDGRRRRERRLK